MRPERGELDAGRPASPIRVGKNAGSLAILIRSRRGTACFVTGLALTAALLWPLTVAPTFRHDDPVEIIRLYEMNRCLHDGQLPCRWAPDLAGLRGEPLFDFYPPLPYYLGELVYLPTQNLLFSAKVMFAVPVLGAFAFMFLCARRLWGDVGGLVAGLAYSYAPYLALDLYIRGAMNELWAYMLLPAVFWALLRVRSAPTAANTAIAATSVGALIATHNLSAMIFLPMAVPLALGLPRWRPRTIAALGGGLLLGVLLAGFYAIPAYFEQSLVHVDDITKGVFDYRRNFTPLTKILAAYSLHDVGRYQLLGCALALPVLAQKIRRRDGETAFLLGGAMVFAVFSIFMTTAPSKPIWGALHPLRFLQFPWRFLETATFFLCLATGAVVQLRLRTAARAATITGLILLLVGRNAGSFQPTNYIHVTQEQLLAGPVWRQSIMHSIVDYLPAAAHETPLQPAGDRYRVIHGSANVSNVEVASDSAALRASSKTGAILRLSIIWFPGWTVEVNGHRETEDHRNRFGLITLRIPSGTSHVRLEFRNTPVRELGNGLSLLGIGALGLLLALPAVRRRSNGAREAQ